MDDKAGLELPDTRTRDGTGRRLAKYFCPAPDCKYAGVPKTNKGLCRTCSMKARWGADKNWRAFPKQAKTVGSCSGCSREIKRNRNLKWLEDGKFLCWRCKKGEEAAAGPGGAKAWPEKCAFWFCGDRDTPKYLEKGQITVSWHPIHKAHLCTLHHHTDYRWPSLVCKLLQVVNRRLGGTSLTSLLESSHEIRDEWHRDFFVGDNWRRFFDSPPNQEPIFCEPSPFDGDLSELSVIEKKPLVPLCNFKARLHAQWMVRPPTDTDLVQAIAAAVDGSLFEPTKPSENLVVRGLQRLVEWWRPAPQAAQRQGERKQKEWEERQAKRKAKRESKKGEGAKRRKGGC
eukprot:tig00021728_g23295.t1